MSGLLDRIDRVIFPEAHKPPIQRGVPGLAIATEGSVAALPARLGSGALGKGPVMPDAGETPEELRDDVDAELEELEADAAEAERRRMAEREAEGLDEPS